MTKKSDCFTDKENPYKVFCYYPCCLLFTNLNWIQNSSENVETIHFQMTRC